MNDVFKYDDKYDYQTNFRIWHDMNSLERRNFNLKEYSGKEAQEVFYSIHKDNLSHAIKINSDGVLEDVLISD